MIGVYIFKPRSVGRITPVEVVAVTTKLPKPVAPQSRCVPHPTTFKCPEIVGLDEAAVATDVPHEPSQSPEKDWMKAGGAAIPGAPPKMLTRICGAKLSIGISAVMGLKGGCFNTR
jgi:hypothetical protein